MELKFVLLFLTLFSMAVARNKKLGKSKGIPYNPYKERIGGVCDELSVESLYYKCPPGTSCVKVKYCS